MYSAGAGMYQGPSQDDYTYDPTLFGPFEHFYRQATLTSNLTAEAMEARDIKQLDMASTGTGDRGAVNDLWMLGDQWCGAAPHGNGTFNSV